MFFHAPVLSSLLYATEGLVCFTSYSVKFIILFVVRLCFVTLLCVVHCLLQREVLYVLSRYNVLLSVFSCCVFYMYCHIEDTNSLSSAIGNCTSFVTLYGSVHSFNGWYAWCVLSHCSAYSLFAVMGGLCNGLSHCNTQFTVFSLSRFLNKPTIHHTFIM